MSAYHVEIRSKEDGRTVCMVDAEVRKVGDIEAVRSGDSVGILVNKETTAVGYLTVEQAKGEFEMHRWPLEGDKGEAVVKAVPR